MFIIKQNKIQCNNCGDTIESKHTHDYVSCSCGQVAVDGGHDYLRRSFRNTPNDFTDLSVVEEEDAV